MSTAPFPMNRAQRRAHYREAKRDEIAIYCPRCSHKTRHMAVPADPNWAKEHNPFSDGMKKETTKCHVVCVACGNILRADVELTPYEYVKQVK